MKKSQNKTIIVFVVLLVICIVFFVYKIIDNSIKGWTSERIITYIYSFTVATIGLAIYLPLSRFFVRSNKKVATSNYKLYKAILEAEKSGKLEKYEERRIAEHNKELLEKINLLIRKKYPDYTEITNNNIGYFFGPHLQDSLLSLNIGVVTSTKLTKLYEDYVRHSSKEFEELYSDYKTGEMIAKPKVPILDFCLPFFFGITGLFAAVYQALSSEGEITNSLTNYLLMFLSFSFLALVFLLYSLPSLIEGVLNKNERIMKEIMSKDNVEECPQHED